MTTTVRRTAGVSQDLTLVQAESGATTDVHVVSLDFTVGSGPVAGAGDGAILATAGGEAVATGTSTLATGSLSVSANGAGGVAAAGASVHVTAEAASADGTAFATASAQAAVAGIGGTGFWLNYQTLAFWQDAAGSAWSASAGEVVHVVDPGGGTAVPDAAIPVSVDASAALPEPSAAGAAPGCGCDSTDAALLEGNLVLFWVDAFAVGTDTFVEADIVALAVEDSLSLLSFGATALVGG